MGFFSELVTIVLLVALLLLSLKERRKQARLESLRDELEGKFAEMAELEAKLKAIEELKASLEKANSELERRCEEQAARMEDLKTALNANSFDGRFPICSNCKDIRDENGCWHSIEEFIANLSAADFSHTLCPDCARKLYPDMFQEGKKLHTLTWK